MKKLLALGFALSVFALSGFAQSVPARTPAEAGARRVAERDAAWAKAHPLGAAVKQPMAHPKAKHGKRVKQVKHSKQLKRSKHAKSRKHA